MRVLPEKRRIVAPSVPLNTPTLTRSCVKRILRSRRVVAADWDGALWCKIKDNSLQVAPVFPHILQTC